MMENLSELGNIKKESSDELNTPTEDVFKQRSDYVINTEVVIKTEKIEDDNELPVYASTSYDTCSNYGIKLADELKLECEDSLDEKMEDPLNVSSDIEGNASTSYAYVEESKNPERIKNEIEEKECLPTLINKNIQKTNRSDNTNILFVKTKKVLKIPKDEKYFCSICNKTFENQTKLNAHTLIHSRNKHIDENGEQETGGESEEVHKAKQYTCSVCHKFFPIRSTFDNHWRIHTGEKPYACHICNKAFAFKTNLTRHILSHSDDKPHACNICQRCFKDKSTLSKHKLIHIGIKPFVCSVCDKSFLRKESLRLHTLLHTGEQPFVCELCNKAYTTEANLIIHGRRCRGEKPFSCDVCNKSFADKSNLTAHRKIHMK